MALFGSKLYNGMYKTNERAFLVKNRPQTKEKSVMYFLVTMSAMGLLSIFIQTTVEKVVAIYSIPPIGIIGLDLIVAMLAINVIIPYWNFIDRKSVTVYGTGAIILTASMLGYI
jgi:hypothetical protein